MRAEAKAQVGQSAQRKSASSRPDLYVLIAAGKAQNRYTPPARATVPG